MNSQEIMQLITNNILEKIDNNAEINIIDETHKHQKHRGFIEGKYHYLLEIKSDILKELNRVKSHKKIYESNSELIEKYIHALSIKIQK